MDLTQDELAIFVSIYYYPIWERVDIMPQRPSERLPVIKSLLSYKLISEALRERRPRLAPGAYHWFLDITGKGRVFFNGLSDVERVHACGDAGLFHLMEELMDLLSREHLPPFLSSEIAFVRDCALARLNKINKINRLNKLSSPGERCFAKYLTW